MKATSTRSAGSRGGSPASTRARLLSSAAGLRPAVGISKLRSSKRVWALNLIVAAGATWLFTSFVTDLRPGHPRLALPWWALSVMFYLAEVFAVRIELRRNAHSFALREVPLVLGLFFAAPTHLVGAQLLGTAVALVLHRRAGLLKLVFVLAHFVLETCVAIMLFRHVALRPDAVDPNSWVGALAAMAAITVISVVLIYIAVSISESRLQLDKFAQEIFLGMALSGASTSLALIVVTLLSVEPGAVWLTAVPTITSFLIYRAYVSEREARSGLEFLYETTRTLQHANAGGHSEVALLERTKDMFRADMAEVLLFSDNGNLRTTVGGPAGPEVMVPVELDRTQGIWAQAVDEGRGLLFARPVKSERIRYYFELRGIRDAMIAPLHDEGRVMGTLMVANRSDEVSTFDREDLKLFETLANNASVSLEKGRLEESLSKLTELESQLTHQAFHDSLTGLANRTLFADRVQHALTRRDPVHNQVPVLFLDLDDFKTINDSLGHDSGDLLLKAVADRLIVCLRPSDTPARLGGDEFAILLSDTHSPEEVVIIASRIMEALNEPFDLQGREIFVRTSIGIAISTSDHDVADELLRNADVAMYRAKSRGKGCYEIFQPSMHAAVLERMELKAELQRAVEQQEFAVYYQPLISLETGRVAGLEALLRWNHPEKGTLSPSSFMSLAEETGLIVPLGAWVLAEACRQVRDWQKRFAAVPRLAVSVNLSARQLQEADLVGEIETILGETGLAPGSLVLEITESALMRNVNETVERLHQLKALGVSIAIDDFGTGYSSLSYLKDFPVDILKIAKPFVDGLTEGPEESALARAIIKLGDTLQLQVVAEGIELAQQRDLLQELSCSLGQGFLFSEPLEATDMESFLSQIDESSLQVLNVADGSLLERMAASLPGQPSLIHPEPAG